MKGRLGWQTFRSDTDTDPNHDAFCQTTCFPYFQQVYAGFDYHFYPFVIKILQFLQASNWHIF